MASAVAEPELDEARRAKKKSSRRHRGEAEEGERHSSSRRKKSSADADAPLPVDDAGERKKKSKKSKHSNREDETPEEREERRRRRREKKAAKAAAAAGVEVPAIDDIPDDRLPQRVVENPPVPLSDSEHEDVVEIVERHIVTAPAPDPPQPSRPPKPAVKPKPPPPAVKPKPPKPVQQPPPPPQPTPPRQEPPPPPARRAEVDDEEDQSSGEDYRGSGKQPQSMMKRWDAAEDMRYPSAGGAAQPGNNYDDEDDEDDVPDEAAAMPHGNGNNNSLGQWSQQGEGYRQLQQPQYQQRWQEPEEPQEAYGRRAVPPPPPSKQQQQPQPSTQLPDPADPSALHRYLADNLEDSEDDENQQHQQQPQMPQQQQQYQNYQDQQQHPDVDENGAANDDYRYYQDRYDQQQEQQAYQDYPEHDQQQPDPEQRFSEMVEADMTPQEPPPIPEGRKGGGGLLGRLFSSFRRGGSSSSKRKPSQQQPMPPQAPSQHPSETGIDQQPGLGEQGKWRSNPSMFNANENATPGNTIDPRLQPTAMMQQQQQQRLIQAGIRTVPDTEVRVILLDGEEIGVPLPRKATGAELMARVCEHIDVQETDYFGLTYVDAKERMWFWLDNEKKVLKQLKHCDNRMLNFQVKFYPPEPNMLFADVTRYQLCLQVRQDIYTGKLPCTWVTQALLGSFQVQSELGDYDLSEHGEIDNIDYLQNFEFVHNQTAELVKKIGELHRGHKGVTPEVADLRYLETARRLEFYGVDLHPARDLDDVDITIGVCFGGVLVYKDRMRISRFAWPKILRISYRKNLFYLKIRSDLYDNVEAVVGFKMMNHKWAKRLWKIAIENHAFFRLKEAQIEKSGSRSSLNFIRGNSSHRFSGRTMHQYRTEGGTLRHSGTFDRSLTKRMSASLPSLKGSQYGSFHSLNRMHPRDMRPVQSNLRASTSVVGSRGVIGGSSRGVSASIGGGRGGGGSAGQQPMMMARTGSVSILPTNAFNRPSSRAPSTASDDLL